MKMWIDDLRPAPLGFYWAKSSAEALEVLTGLAPVEVQGISFDHDLGGEDTTRRVMLWMVEREFWPNHVHIHTANPVGRDWLVGMVRQYAPDFVTMTY